MKHVALRVIACGALIAASAFAQNNYRQVNLVSDLPNIAGTTGFPTGEFLGNHFRRTIGPLVGERRRHWAFHPV